jgi:outer membrane immunogenic protein
MKLAHSIVAGAALAVSMAATSASAADLLVTPDPIYDSPLFNFEGLYLGGTGGVALSGGVFGTLGGVAGANFAITDGIIVGGEFQFDTYWNGGGYAGYDALGLARVGGFLADNTMIYGDVGAGLMNGAPVYAFGGGVELALTDQLSARGDLQGIGAFGGVPTMAKATAGLLWHIN